MLRGLARIHVLQGGSRPILAAMLATALAIGAQTARADAYPDHPIRLVVPYAAGGAVDIVARSVGQRMSQQLKQPVIVDNRPGASTNIGMDFVAKAPADGYDHDGIEQPGDERGAVQQTQLQPGHGFRASGADWRGIAGGRRAGQVEHHVDEGADRPGQGGTGQAQLGSAGNGSSGHLAGEMLKESAGIDVLHVPYKGGAPAITDLIGERLTFMPINPLK
jgi:tripartite-type tricarboxylate transporter receptor subunit TctC